MKVKQQIIPPESMPLDSCITLSVADPGGGVRGFNPPRFFCLFGLSIYENSRGPGPYPPPPPRRIPAQNPPPLEEFLDPPLLIVDISHEFVYQLVWPNPYAGVGVRVVGLKFKVQGRIQEFLKRVRVLEKAGP